MTKSKRSIKGQKMADKALLRRLHPFLRNIINILLGSSLEPPLRSLCIEKQMKTLRTKNSSMHYSMSMPMPSAEACTFASSLLSSKGSNKPCNQGSSGQQQLIPGWSPDPVSKAPSFATLFWAPINLLLLSAGLKFFPIQIKNVVIPDHAQTGLASAQTWSNDKIISQ